MSEWKKVKFLDYIELNPKVSIAKGEVCPFIEMANVDCNMRQPRCFEYKPFTSGVKFQTYDTVIARIEPCLQNGKGFLFTKQTTGFGSTEYLVFRAKPGKATPLFVYYFMRTHKIKTLMCNSMSGATGRQRVNNDVFLNLEIEIPPYDEQHRIATILSRYDSLIENYQKQIKLLEEAAQRLYKEWFIDLRFPGHENTKIVDGIPEGWEKKQVGDVTPIKTGKKDANFGTDNGPFPFFTCAQEPIKAPSYSFDTSAVILAGNGDFNVKLYRGKFEAYQRTYVLEPTNENMLYLLYFCISENMNRLATGASGSTIKFLTKGMIESLVIIEPSICVLDSFNQIIEPIRTQKENLQSQIRLLTEARDRLLPKLMSGEINV